MVEPSRDSACHRAGGRQIGQARLFDLAAAETQPVHLAVVSLGVAPTDENQPVAGRDACAVGKRTVKRKAGCPARSTGFENEDLVAPNLLTTLKRRYRKVGTTGDDQSAVGRSRERATQAQGLG